MRVMPAIDLREGACVQLVGGRYEDERVRIADPLAAARRWRDAGLAELHVVDLDAATGRGSNRTVVHALLAEPGLVCQVGGGVRDDDAVECADRGRRRARRRRHASARGSGVAGARGRPVPRPPRRRGGRPGPLRRDAWLEP
jgi:hypothetical protein